MLKRVFEGVANFDSEDGGKALIATIYDQPPDGNVDLFIRLQSWDKTCQHPEASQIAGKRIRITVEELP